MVKLIRNTRYVLRRRRTYNNKSNQFVIKRTPGSRLVVQYRKKKLPIPRAPKHLGHERIKGIKKIRKSKLKKLKPSQRTIARPYGAMLTYKQVRDRIVKAFLIEEQKIVKKVLQLKNKKKKQQMKN